MTLPSQQPRVAGLVAHMADRVEYALPTGVDPRAEEPRRRIRESACSGSVIPGTVVDARVCPVPSL